ncbi:MAG: DUF4919 domain-containing protein [Calditrichaeota bacterium]|nr:DUF4919 domain-containing protein [Calditrichota bacterium]
MFSICLWISCASHQKEPAAEVAVHSPDPPDSTAIEDTLTNYAAFEYVDLLTADDFLTKLDSIKGGLSQDFFTLRMAYTKTGAYTPYGETSRDSLNKAGALFEEKRFSEALTVLNNVLRENYVSISTHSYASYAWEMLGDSTRALFHLNMYQGLLNSIYDYGNGNSPQSAYIVISTREEYEFLNWFGLQFKEQNLIAADEYSFDLMKAVDPETNEQFDIYFNIQIPFTRLSNAFK